MPGSTQDSLSLVCRTPALLYCLQVLARNPRPGLTKEQQQVLKDLHFTDNGLDTKALSDDQKLALIAAIPLGQQGLAQSFYVIGSKEHGYWYTTW